MFICRFVISLFLLLVFTPLYAQDAAILSGKDRIHPVAATEFMVVTQEALATQVGVDILNAGGNAVDAAVAVGFALAVTLPRAGNLGGGGFMMVHLAETGETFALDYREMAPARATRDMYLDKNGNANPLKSRFTYQSAGVPGSVAGLCFALNNYGTMPLKKVLAPAIKLAEEGYVVSQGFSRSLSQRKLLMLKNASTRKIFFHKNGTALQPGEIFKQPDLAWSLKQISAEGSDAFYKNEIAKRIVSDMKKNNGLITLEDLKNYHVVVREPVRGKYRGFEIASMPPPSSGGVHLVQMLKILEGFDLKKSGANSAETIHLMAETMKRAYADRSKHLGDPDFSPIPVKTLISNHYADKIRKKINPRKATVSKKIKPGDLSNFESNDTTHFSIIDRWGNVVSNTYTINFSYGSGIVAEGTGILLNNEMDDFSAKPGVPNAYGLIGGKANAIEPRKRPLSSMTPTIVFKNDEPFLITGSPGGSRIITTVLQIILNIIDHEMNLAEATLAARVHHQWLPDELRIEQGISPDTIKLLNGKGHTIVEKDAMGCANSILKNDNGIFGFADPRRVDGKAKGK